MPKASKPGYYAVRIGRVPGIYLSWAECEEQVKGFTGAMFKKLNTEAEANEFLTARPRTTRSSAARDAALVAPSTSVIPDPKTRSSRSTTQEPDDGDVVYCDGACKGNGQPGSVAGVGVWWGHGDSRNISERCPGDQTNNRAELIAIVRVLETTPHLKRKLLVKTDSKYSIQCITTWILKWMKNGFLAADGKPVKNRALIKYLAALLHVRHKTSQIVEFEHVRGHVGIQGNEAADQLANLGATKPTVPERDWERLEKEKLKSLTPVRPIKVAEDDLKAYADGLLSDDRLAELASSTSVRNIASPEPPQNATRLRASVSPPRLMRLEGGPSATYSRSTLPSSVLAAGVTVPSNKNSMVMSKAELEMYASCLLGDDELTTLGRDGIFDSDF